MSNNTEVIIDGQLALATAAQTGEIIASGGAKDLTCIVKDGDNKEQLALKVANLNGGGGGGGGLPSQTGHSGQFLTTDGSNPSWDDVNTNLPAFPAPSETVSTVAYTSAGGTSAITGKEIQSITFNDESSTPTIYPEVSSGTKTLSFFIGRGDSYNSSTDILLEMEFAWENNILISGKMNATYNGSTSKLYFIVYNEGNYEYAYWNSVEYINGVPIYWDGTNKKIWSSLNFKANNITDIEGIGDNKISFETITQNNSLPAASSYTNKLAYVYETGTYSDIKNLIYSDGTNWNFLPGAVLQIPDERMYEAANKLTPAYCGIALTSGQLAIPARNKSDAIYPNYTIGQMHEFYVDTYSWLNRFWNPMNFGTIFHNNMQWLTQNEEDPWAPEVTPDIYSSYTFINNGQTTYTQTVKVNLSNSVNFCQWVFAQGTNKIKLQFENATNAKVFLNGQEVNTANDLLLDADSKTYIANFYNYSDSSGYLVMDIKELPYSSSALPQVVDLGSVSTTTALSTNINYTATLNGSASFTLPTPSDTSIENTINLLLNVSSSTTVDWGVNANSVLSSFAAGKYEIRLRYNNATDNWIGEVLKAEDVPNSVKLYVPFNNTAEDLSNNPVSLSANNTSDNFPSYNDRTNPEGYVGTKALQMVVNNNFHWFTPSNNLSKLNLGTGDFTIMLWAKASSSGIYWEINALRVDSNNYLSVGRFVIGGTTIIDLLNYWSGTTDNEWHHFCWTRSGNTWRGFIDGVLKKTATSSASVDFSSVARIAYLYYTFGQTVAEIQELIVKNTCDYITDFTPPTAPYILADNSLADLHDSTKQDVLTTITGYDASKTQVLKNVQGVLTWVDEA